ncbi:MAG: glycosyltransferase family 2 protein [Candidatus Omnitrophica bacterium]|nr:glycosyltransferase family 2 protein [Candidatus Omnitrophota bacterium]
MLTVIIATHNGENTLPITLNAFCNLLIPKKGWELIVVDNVSTDTTAKVIEGFTHKLPITYIYDNSLGKFHAINVGLEYAHGELIIFTDDDVVPQEDWLIQLDDCANSLVEYSIFCGPIRPLWPREPDPWILHNVDLGAVYAITDESLIDGEIPAGGVWGGNFAIRKQIFDLGFRFNPDVGCKGRNYRMGGETELITRLSQKGYKSWFCKRAVVQHIIRDYQLEEKWILERAFKFGRGEAYKERLRRISEAKLFGLPRWVVRKLLKSYYLLITSLFNGDKKKFFRARWDINFFHG